MDEVLDVMPDRIHKHPTSANPLPQLPKQNGTKPEGLHHRGGVPPSLQRGSRHIILMSSRSRGVFATPEITLSLISLLKFSDVMPSISSTSCRFYAMLPMPGF